MLHCTLLPDWRALVIWSTNGRKDNLGDRPLVNVLPSFVTSNETDSLDIGVIADGVDSGNASMNNVEDTGW